MLFKGKPGTDVIKVIWMIPARELWQNFEYGKMTENDIIAQSIYNFLHNRVMLEAKEDGDLPDDVIDKIYTEISKSSKYKKI